MVMTTGGPVVESRSWIREVEDSILRRDKRFDRGMVFRWSDRFIRGSILQWSNHSVRSLNPQPEVAIVQINEPVPVKNVCPQSVRIWVARPPSSKTEKTKKVESVKPRKRL